MSLGNSYEKYKTNFLKCSDLETRYLSVERNAASRPFC